MSSSPCKVSYDLSVAIFHNTLHSQLIATPAGKVKGPIFPLGVDIDQYIPLHLPHVSPQCRHIAAKQSAHMARATHTFWSLLCGCIAQNSTYQGAYSYAVYMQYSYTYAVYWIGRCRLFPTMQCGNGPLPACIVTDGAIYCESIVFCNAIERHSHSISLKGLGCLGIWTCLKI